ncbi:hypothetical protein EPA93_13820 [Ktedonosporobacter rubrisoli]|uniref:Uncharacterized protein n=1 Tax=Ktedonosporobacter rubrisoli TaxID=2509675 RepID=A0A4P6JNY8_KTERU|nr:hypothetical protein [Ktedonosporobacter rubrisoli]QBD77024.1 hypothetical protein EPA93_13820 [Ktedonosporobacter rubrisoli]
MLQSYILTNEVTARNEILHEVRRRLVGAVILALGLLLGEVGVAWDVQWHANVGPDTFFTAPHMMVFGGMALAGLPCLFITLLSTYNYHRRESAQVVATTTVPVLGGSFHAPLGFLIAGLGAVVNLLNGAYDLWWHSVYGFDAVVFSPPHIGLSLAEHIAIVGAMYAFAELYHLSPAGTWLRRATIIGIAFAAALMLCSLSFYLPEVPGLFDLLSGRTLVAVAFSSAILLLLVAVFQRPWIATLAGGIFTLFYVGNWLFAPWATAVYASSLNLLMREGAYQIAVLPCMYPAGFLVAALSIDALFLLARRLHWNNALCVFLLSGIAALLLALCYPPLYVFSGVSASMVPTLLVAPLLGMVCGTLGWMLGYTLRQSSQANVGAILAASVKESA